jgi:hypothetical protein
VSEDENRYRPEFSISLFGFLRFMGRVIGNIWLVAVVRIALTEAVVAALSLLRSGQSDEPFLVATEHGRVRARTVVVLLLSLLISAAGAWLLGEAVQSYLNG